MSAKNRNLRPQFTRGHQNCTTEDLNNVSRSDESPFLRQPQIVRSELDADNIKAWIHAGYVMVWDFLGTFFTVWSLPILCVLSSDSCFQQDNSTCHKAQNDLKLVS